MKALRIHIPPTTERDRQIVERRQAYLRGLFLRSNQPEARHPSPEEVESGGPDRLTP